MTTVTSDQIEVRLTEVLVSLGTDPDAINRDAELTELDVDSLDLVEVAQIVEEEYGVKLEGDDLKGITTVGGVFDLVASRAS